MPCSRLTLIFSAKLTPRAVAIDTTVVVAAAGVVLVSSDPAERRTGDHTARMRLVGQQLCRMFTQRLCV